MKELAAAHSGLAGKRVQAEAKNKGAKKPVAENKDEDDEDDEDEDDLEGEVEGEDEDSEEGEEDSKSEESEPKTADAVEKAKKVAEKVTKKGEEKAPEGKPKREVNEAELFLGNLPFTATSEQVTDFFKKYGEVVAVKFLERVRLMR